MPTATAFQRTPLVVVAGNLVAGPVRSTFVDGDRESLLHSYLVLVRQLRGQQRATSITLRGDDICAIADHLGVSQERVLDDLLDRMGATQAQRKKLFALFAIGALSIVATGSVALDLAPAGALAPSDAAPVVASVVASVDVSSSVAVAETAPVEVALEPELALAVGGVDWELMVSLQQLTDALAAPPVADLDIDSREGLAVDAGVGVADDGSVVAVAEPPIPMPEVVGVGVGVGVGVADDGSVVAVAEPPLPTP
jgi:hypothetical protein